MMMGMTREKATITVDRAKLEQVRALTGASSASQAIDLALAEVIRIDRVRRDIAAYREQPSTDEEIALAQRRARWSDLDDDTDWEAVYGEATS
jgi:hypothetical protein